MKALATLAEEWLRLKKAELLAFEQRKELEKELAEYFDKNKKGTQRKTDGLYECKMETRAEAYSEDGFVSLYDALPDLGKACLVPSYKFSANAYKQIHQTLQFLAVAAPEHRVALEQLENAVKEHVKEKLSAPYFEIKTKER